MSRYNTLGAYLDSDEIHDNDDEDESDDGPWEDSCPWCNEPCYDTDYYPYCSRECASQAAADNDRD